MTCNDWPIVWPCAAPDDSTPAQFAAAQTAAQSLLWARTGRRLGTCIVTEEYSARRGPCAMPYNPEGWRGLVGSTLFLQSTPVQSVQSVTVDGLLLNPADYRLIGARLESTLGLWPIHGSVVVEYTYGLPIEGTTIEGLVSLAMGEVANELLQAMCGGACRLSARAVSVTRAGVTVEMGSADDVAAAGKLGTELADLLIDTVNPGAKRDRSRVYSPDMAGRVR